MDTTADAPSLLYTTRDFNWRDIDAAGLATIVTAVVSLVSPLLDNGTKDVELRSTYDVTNCN